ncbi:peptidoglycan editing factor PgeF [Marichromatium bheemlicum]|uniref:Purine nucleoside phosphorylase n=1 Tax=Marichromatium bheemlicum TaxID=365339 RepID=A0ABX1I9R6_9GAMM|nr:peptidoglycan editing factor PgeF [Marichromatium bheemlicum]NKN33946.1 peptidoglycan editing factor PgeF [Marichromatium bheemlicum]
MTPIRPDWPAPAAVRALVTTRSGGVSQGPYASLNLATHVGDDPARVARNRALLRQHAGLPSEPLWLDQVHGCVVADDAAALGCQADAAVSAWPGRVCAVLTADCLPLLLCDREGTRVAAVHAGWRGLAGGVIERTLAALALEPSRLLAWLGPAIGPSAFEVGPEVRARFVDLDVAAADAFRPGRAGRWLADLFMLARQRLVAAGVPAVYGGGQCTHIDPQRFFSYRRDGTTGRMASLIWLDPAVAAPPGDPEHV